MQNTLDYQPPPKPTARAKATTNEAAAFDITAAVVLATPWFLPKIIQSLTGPGNNWPLVIYPAGVLAGWLITVVRLTSFGFKGSTCFLSVGMSIADAIGLMMCIAGLPVC